MRDALVAKRNANRVLDMWPVAFRVMTLSYRDGYCR